MKKLVTILTVVLFSISSFAQEKEIDAALYAMETNNIAAAKSEIAKLESQINSNTISPESKAKFYYTAGRIALNEGDMERVGLMFEQLRKYETGIMYSAKNKNTKETEYFESKQDADNASANGNYAKVKEVKLDMEYFPQIQSLLGGQAEKILAQASAAYQAGNAAEAGEKYLEASAIANALGAGDPGMYKYLAALNFHEAEQYDKALNIYKGLIESGFTGESTDWVATDIESGDDVYFKSKEDAEFQQKLKQVKNIRKVERPSEERNLYSNALKVLYNLNQYDPIVETIINKYPQDKEIQGIAADVYLNTGNEEAYLQKLEDNIRIDPNNETNHYNKGVILMRRDRDEEALAMFKKAIELNPDYKNAYNNAAVVIMKPAKEYIKIINDNLGRSAKEKNTYDEYNAKLISVYKEAIPYLEKMFEIDPNDYESARILRQAYQNAEMFDEADRMKAIESSLQGN